MKWVNVGIALAICVIAALAINLFFILPGPDGFVLKCSYPEVPDSMMVFTVDDENVTAEYVNRLADLFNVTGTGQAKGDGTVFEKGDNYLFIDNSGGIVFQSRTYNNSLPVNLPGENESIAIAGQFLRDNRLMPDDVGLAHVTPIIVNKNYPSNGTTISYTAARSVSFERSINGTLVTGPSPRLIVTVSDNGRISCLDKSWPRFTAYAMKPLKTPEQAFSDLANGKDILLKSKAPGQVEISHVSLCYYMDPVTMSPQYVEPVYVFSGGRDVPLKMVTQMAIYYVKAT